MCVREWKRKEKGSMGRLKKDRNCVIWKQGFNVDAEQARHVKAWKSMIQSRR
uniref:Uncharacterized protein n=1 Tax=Helianthus annuus TaxID=4232 RepID=A0A251UXY4_HELAN